MNTDVKGTMDNDTGYVTKRKIKKGKKYKRKHKNESVTEKNDQRTDKEEQEINSVVRDEQGNVIPKCSGDVTQESVSPTKKAKKRKHLNDLITADIVKTKDQGKEVVGHVKDKKVSDVPPIAGVITEGSSSQKNLVPETMEVKTDGKLEKINQDVKEKSDSVLISTSRDFTKESHNKKKKKAKKQSHQSDLMIKDIVKSMLSSSGVITEEASSSKNAEKTKKRKHKKDIVSEKQKVKAENQREIHPDVKEKSGSLISPGISDVTKGSGSPKKRKKAKKQDHKNKEDSMTEKVRDQSESKEKEIKTDVQKQSGSGIFPSSGDVGKESGSWYLVINDPVKTKGQEKKVSADANDKKSGADIRENSNNREKRKKAKKHKLRQKKDFMFEEMQVETEGKEINQDVKQNSDIVVLLSCSDVTEKSRSCKKKDDTKNHKQQCDLIIEDAVEIKGHKKEENAGVKNIKQENISRSCGDLTEKSSFHEKTKKAKKHKHRPVTYSMNKEIQEKTKGKEKDVNKNVKDKTDNVIRPGRSDVMNVLHNRERKGENTEKDENTKMQKHQSHLKIEDTVKAKGQERERNADVKGKKDNVKPPIGSNIPDQQAKKKKHERIKAEDGTEGKEKEVNRNRKEKLDSVIFPCSSDVTEESRNREKKESTVKQKHQSDLVIVDIEKTKGKKMNINAVLEKKKDTDMPSSHGGITKGSGDRKKTKKKKDKCKHKKHSIAEIVDETEDKETKEVNKDAKDNSHNLISPSTADVTMKSISLRESKKLKKRKYESDNGTEISEVIGKHVNTGVIDKSRNTISPRSGNITEVLGCEEKRKLKQSKKRRYENEIVTEKTQGKGSEVNAGFKDEAGKVTSSSNGNGKEDSGSCEKKKARKRRSEVDKVSEKTYQEEVNAAGIYTNLPSNTDVTTEELRCSKEKKQWKKRNCESNSVTERREGSWKEVNADGKDNLEGRMAREQANSTNNAISNQVITRTTAIIDVDDITDNTEVCKTSEVVSKPNKHDEKKEIAGRTGNQWDSADFDSFERKEKFLRLMGALKLPTRQRQTSKYSALAMNKKQEEAFVSSLEQHYFHALHTGKGKGVGLGYK